MANALWTTKAPTEVGFYWVKLLDGQTPEPGVPEITIAYVYKYDDELMYSFLAWYGLDEEHPTYAWLGPINPPISGETLRPCPFCGGKNLTIKQISSPSSNKPNDKYLYFVKCEDCGAHGSGEYSKEISEAKKFAIYLWNSRCTDSYNSNFTDYCPFCGSTTRSKLTYVDGAKDFKHLDDSCCTYSTRIICANCGSSVEHKGFVSGKTESEKQALNAWLKRSYV